MWGYQGERDAFGSLGSCVSMLCVLLCVLCVCLIQLHSCHTSINWVELSWVLGEWGLGELSELSPGRSRARKRFYYNLISANSLCWQQVTANSSLFRPEKWRYGTPQSKKWGYRYPSYPINYAYGHYTFARCMCKSVVRTTAKVYGKP